MTMIKGFEAISEDELMEVNGGLGQIGVAIAWSAIGYLGGKVVDNVINSFSQPVYGGPVMAASRGDGS